MFVKSIEIENIEIIEEFDTLLVVATARLTLEARHELLVGSQLLRHELEGDVPLELAVTCP